MRYPARTVELRMEDETVQHEGWNVIDRDAAILWREYSFAKGAYATMFVFRTSDGLAVVSPGRGVDARALDALSEFGKVRALIANNPLHHMGQKEWRAHFPDVESYCPPGAVAKLEKKVAGVKFRPLSELALPASARWDDVPGFKSGEAILRVDSSRGAVWYTGDLLTNIQRTPGPPMSWLFSLADSAPGFRLFKPCVWAFIKDKKAVRGWALDRLVKEPPVAVVPAHGPAVDSHDVAVLARAQINKL